MAICRTCPFKNWEKKDINESRVTALTNAFRDDIFFTTHPKITFVFPRDIEELKKEKHKWVD